MSQSSNSIKGIVDEIANCLQNVNISEPANDKISGVSITSKQKTLIAALSVSLKTEDSPISEPLILRKILEAIITGILVPANSQLIVHPAPVSPIHFPNFDNEQYVPKSEYDELRAAYDEIFIEAAADNVVILSQEDYENLLISEDKISQIVDIAQEYEREEAIEIITQILNNEDTDEYDPSGGY